MMAGEETESTMSAAEAREKFSEVVNRAAYGKERVVLVRRGRPVAAVVSLDDLRLLEELEERADLRAAKRAEEEAAREGVIPWETIKAESGL